MTQPPIRPCALLQLAAAAAVAAGLAGCNKPEATGPATTSFDAITTACTQFLAARQPHVLPGAAGDWTLTGYSPALVQPEVTRTESTVTPYVGKLVIKDNEAQAHAPTEAAAQAIERAVAETLADGYLTGDLLQGKSGKHPVQSTSDMGSQIAARIREI